MSMWDFLKRKTKGFEDELAFKLVVEPGLDWLKKKVSGTVEKKVARIEAVEKYLDEHRGEVIIEAETLLPPRESRRILTRAQQRKKMQARGYGDKRPYGRNAENEMWDALALLRKARLDEPEGYKGFVPAPRERYEMWRNDYIAIANESPQGFDTIVDATNRDTAKQYALMVWDFVDKHWDKIDAEANKMARKVRRHIKERNGLIPGKPRSTLRRHPANIYVLGAFLDPIGWILRGLTK